jgi:hypothetical protein
MSADDGPISMIGGDVSDLGCAVDIDEWVFLEVAQQRFLEIQVLYEPGHHMWAPGLEW